MFRLSFSTASQMIDQQAIRLAFNEDGYYHARQVFSPKEVHELEGAFDQIVHQLLTSPADIDASWKGEAIQKIRSQQDQIFHTHNVHQYSAVWSRAMFQSRFLAIAEAILGPDIILHHNKLFQKPAGTGAPFPMHQDWSYFPTLQDSMIAGIIHISAATNEMGCLRVYPGSHRLGRHTGTNGQETPAPIMADYPIEQARIIEAEPGDVLFFHYFTLHGSLPNRSAHPRKTVLMQLHAGTDRMEAQADHPDERLVLKGWNHHSSRERAGSRK